MGCVGADSGSGSVSTKNGDMKALPTKRGVERATPVSAKAPFPCSCISSRWSLSWVHNDESGKGERKQPTVRRGSCSAFRSSCDFGSKSVIKICTISGRSTDRSHRRRLVAVAHEDGTWTGWMCAGVPPGVVVKAVTSRRG